MRLGHSLRTRKALEKSLGCFPRCFPKKCENWKPRYRVPCLKRCGMFCRSRVTRGCECGDLGIVDFAGLPGGFGREEISPPALSIAGDECGNFWVMDLTTGSQTWGPIYYACHDAPVFVHQTSSLAYFIEEALRGEIAPWKSAIGDVHDELSHQVWRTNAGVLSYEECATSSDVDLRAFAKSVGPTYEFVDLRSPKLGDGFSWGSYGRRFVVKRCGEKTHLRKPNKQVAMAEIQG